MSAAKMKTTSSATAASTDVQERIRKHQQQQQYQQQRQQDNKIGSSVAGTATGDPPPATSTSTPAATPAIQVPTKTIPTTAVETTANTLQGAVGGRGGGRRNRTKKMRSASGDDFKRSTIDKRKASAAKEKRHVNFISTNSKSTAGAGGSSKLMKKSASGLRAQNTDPTTSDPSGLPSVSKSKSILKVKHVVVLKRKAGTGKVSKKFKKAPQGAQAELEAAELSKLAQQFTRTLPEAGAAEDTQLLPARSASQEDGGKNKRRLLKRRHSAATKHAPSGAGIVESGSVNVPPVRRFSPVTDKSALSDGRDVKVYGEGNFDAMKTLDLPTTSRNITVAMVKEQHNKEAKESNAEQQQQQEQVPNQPSNSNENTNTANTANISPVEVAHVRSRRAGSLTSAAPAASGGGGSVSAAAVANAIPDLVDAQIVLPIDDPNALAAAGAITSNNSHSSKEGKVNEESAAKTSTEAAAVAGPSTSSQTAEDDKDKEEDKDAKKKKNRCAECRKKVGLTGFQCRCGGLYCAVHRYSDKHDCTFNYREHGAQEIRRNNPVVVGEKIQKI